MPYTDFSPEETVRRGEQIYEQQLRERLEPGNVGKFLVIDIETGEYEIDEDRGAAGRRMMAKHPDHARYMKRIGYDAVESFGTSQLQRTKA